MLDPYKRLGSGPEGTPLSFTALKQHEFFKGVDFAAVLKASPPLDPIILAKLHSDKKKVLSGFESPTELTTSSDSLEEEEEKSPGCIHEQAQEQGKILKEGFVDKKCGWIFYYKRKLLLTSQPRLSYYVPKNNEYRVKAIKVNNRKFQIVTPHRVYYFKGLDAGSTDEWVNAINGAIRDYCPDT